MVRGNLLDQQPSVVGGHGRPDPCLLRLSQPRRRHAQPCCEVLCASDARSEGLTCVQVLEHTRVSLICLAPWTGAPTLVRRWVCCRSALYDGSVIYLRYLSTSLLWWQAVAAIIGVTSSNTLRNNSRCTRRHREGARNVDNTAIRHAISPLHSCESVMQTSTAAPEALHRSGPLSRSGTPGGAHGRRNDPIASPCHGMRCPPDHPLFASWPWLLHTEYSLEAIDMTVQ
jgi:hypothetical protein